MTTFPVILDVAIGMVFIFLTLSAISSVINELIARWTNARGEYLARGIQFLLWDQEAFSGSARFPILKRLGIAATMNVDETTGLVGYILKHPLLRRLGTDYPRFPAYIPSTSFSLALLEGIRIGNPVARVEFLAQTFEKVALRPEGAAIRSILQPLKGALDAALADPAIKYVQSATRSGTLTTETLDALKNNLSATLALDGVDRALADARLAAAALQDPQVKVAVEDFFDALNANEIRHQIEALPNDYVNPQIRSTLLALVDEAQAGVQKLEAVKQTLEGWFDEGMKRVSVQYKRYAQAILIAIGIALCLVLNADALRIIDTLWNDPTLRAVLVAEAQAASQSGQPANGGAIGADTSAQIEALRSNLAGVPLGWDGTEWTSIFHDGGADVPNLLRKLAGIALMSVGVGFGAPFWYDVLTKLVPLRADKPKTA